MSNVMVWGEVRRAYNMAAEPDQLFRYLSDIKTLLTNVPNAERIQLRKPSGRARVFFGLNVMAISLNIFVDVEPNIDKATHTIKLAPPAQPLGDVPRGYLTGDFLASVRISPNDKGGSRIGSILRVGFDPNKVELLSALPRSFLETSGQSLLQQYVENTSTEYIARLVQDFARFREAEQANQ